MRGDLEKAYEFEPVDLLFNQNGQLSERQIKLVDEYRRIKKFGGRLALGCFFLSILLVIFIPLYAIGLDDLRRQPEIAIIFGVVFFISTGLVGFSFLLGNIRSDLKSGKISMVEGFAEKWDKKMPGRLGTAYYVRIDKVKFHIETAARYKAFQSNTNYRVFYVRHNAHIILSIDEISPRNN